MKVANSVLFHKNVFLGGKGGEGAVGGIGIQV